MIPTIFEDEDGNGQGITLDADLRHAVFTGSSLAWALRMQANRNQEALCAINHPLPVPATVPNAPDKGAGRRFLVHPSRDQPGSFWIGNSGSFFLANIRSEDLANAIAALLEGRDQLARKHADAFLESAGL